MGGKTKTNKIAFKNLLIADWCFGNGIEYVRELFDQFKYVHVYKTGITIILYVWVSVVKYLKRRHIFPYLLISTSFVLYQPKMTFYLGKNLQFN